MANIAYQGYWVNPLAKATELKIVNDYFTNANEYNARKRETFDFNEKTLT